MAIKGKRWYASLNAVKDELGIATIPFRSNP